jgi:tetratricopeptide (TPR) repeat protein
VPNAKDLKKQQLILLGSAIVVMAALLVFGKTVPPKKAMAQPVTEGHAPHADHDDAAVAEVSIEKMSADARKQLNPQQLEQLKALEAVPVTATSQKQLSDFWKGIHHHELTLHYLAESAKLENSEKSLTFAAHLMLNNMMEESDAQLQHWYATQSKELFEKALVINPGNDSSRIGLGATYMFGHVSDNPMQGILPIREIAEKNPDNLYAQMMLGLGGMQSGQFEKAIPRFKAVVEKQPDNVEAAFHLAEAYELSGDKENAVKWYRVVQEKIPVEQAKKDIEARIKTLQ